MNPRRDPVHHHALITGASSGLGEGMAKRLAAGGTAVTLIARRRERLEAVAGEIRSAGGRVRAVPGDVGRRDDVLRAADAGARSFGPVDLLIANAGVADRTPARGLDGRRVEEVLRVNLLGMVYAVEAVLPGMLEGARGRIVGISSLAGVRGLPGAAAYCASKAGMNAFLESLRVELDGTGVGVSIISPGFVRTPMTDRHRTRRPFLVESDRAVQRILRDVERGRSSSYFPLPLSIPVRLGRFLPDRLYDAMARRLGKARGRGEPRS